VHHGVVSYRVAVNRRENSMLGSLEDAERELDRRAMAAA
jgi:hypothetical protein